MLCLQQLAKDRQTRNLFKEKFFESKIDFLSDLMI